MRNPTLMNATRFSRLPRFCRVLRTGLVPLVAVSLLAAASVPSAVASTDRYRVELLVFRNVAAVAEPVEVDEVRRFRSALALDEPAMPAVPVMLEKDDGTFANIWARLERLAEYEPLLRMTFEQSMFDFHPQVRIHNDERLAEELYFPGGIAYISPSDTSAGNDWFEDYRRALYRLDGTLQLRRSRFLHIDLDLEYRLDGEAWSIAFPDNEPEALSEGFEWVTEPPPASPGNINDVDDTSIIEPFRLHRLQQSRQVRSNTLQYFDSAFLGAIVRVTPISDNPQ